MVAELDNTRVQFTFPVGTTVDFNNAPYDSNTPLIVNLDRFGVFHIEHDENLTGTRVTSLDGGRRIAVFAGRRSVHARDVTRRRPSHRRLLGTQVSARA